MSAPLAPTTSDPASVADPPPALELRGVTKRFGGVTALDNVSLSLRPGEVLGVIGPNGAGKSTLLRVVSGLHHPDEGEVRIGGVVAGRRGGPVRAARSGVAVASQIPRPFARLTVRDNVRVGALRAGRHGGLLADRILEQTGLVDKADRRAGSLRLLDLKRLELARALSLDPSVLLLDEIAAGLIAEEVAELVSLLEGVVADRTVVVVEHVDAVIRELAGRVAVLDWGRLVADAPADEISADPRVAAIYFGAEAAEHAPPPAPSAPSGPPLLQLDNVRAGYGGVPALHGVGLKVHPGEIVAVLGANGAGKTTLTRVVSGLHPRFEGFGEFAGEPLAGLAAHERVDRGIAHCQEGRRVFAPLTVRENLELGAHAPRIRARLDESMARAFELFPELEGLLGRPAGVLSGGQQQMLAIARALMSDPRLVLFDEVSIGLAPKVVDRIYGAIEEIAASGIAVLLVEQNVHRSLALAARAYVLQRGRVSFAGPSLELADPDRLRAAYFGSGPVADQPRAGRAPEGRTP